MDETGVSVAICIRNMDKYIRDCILSILNQSHANLELIIVDDLSSDNTQKFILQFNDKRIRYLRNKTLLGLSQSRNISVSKARFEHIFFTDADCVVSRTWIEEGLKTLKIPGIVGVEGKTFYVSEDYKPTRSDSIMENRLGGAFLTCNIAFKKSVITQAGGFDPRFNYHEDRDLAIRVIKIGHVNFNPKMVVYHQKRKLNPKQFVQTGNRLRNRVLLYKKYRDRPKNLFLGRIVYPNDFIKIMFPILLFGSFHKNRYKGEDDFRIFPFIYVRLIYERLMLWDMCARERVFLI